MSRDRYQFTIDTALALREGRQIDAIAVAEELEQVGRSDARELRHRVEQIIEHMLKLSQTKGDTLRYNKRLWTASIRRQRHEIATLLEESPSLRRLLTPEFIQRAHTAVAYTVRAEYRVRVPAECLWTADDIITGAKDVQ